jgi:glucokinase
LGSTLLDQLAALVERAKCAKLEAVGIGVPSVEEFEAGRVISSMNVPLVDVAIRQVLGERLGVPVFVDNDATVAARAEAHDEQLRMVAKNLVMLTVGTGIGGGLVLGGRIYRGATAVRDGDPAAIGAVETWAEHVGIGVASAINTCDPDEVALGGGGARAAELLLEPVRRVARSYVVPGLGRNTRIRLTRHGARAGVLGAGLLALHELQP